MYWCRCSRFRCCCNKSATDPRTVGQQVDDGTLEARVSGQLNKDKEITGKARIIATAYKGNVLLTGQSPDMAWAERAKQIASNVDGTIAVYNEVCSGEPVDLVQPQKILG